MNNITDLNYILLFSIQIWLVSTANVNVFFSTNLNEGITACNSFKVKFLLSLYDDINKN
jgi:hypothetical protein